MSAILESEEDFRTIVLDHLVEAGGRAVVLFTAPAWCRPCQQFEPHFDKAAGMVDEVLFAKVIMGETPEDTSLHWATKEFGIRGVPQAILFDQDGRRVLNARSVIPLIKEIG